MISDMPALRVRPNPFARMDYFTTDPSTGVTRTPSNARVCALSNDFLNGFRDAVIYETGKSYRRIIKRTGVRWGELFMKRFDKEVSAHYKTPLLELSTAVVHTCLMDAFNFHGWGLLSIDMKHLEQGVLVTEVRNSVMPALVAESDRPVDMLMAGFLAAIFSYLSGQKLDAVQTDCPSQGADASRFLIAVADRIRELEAWMLKTMPHTAIPHNAALKRLLGNSDSPFKDGQTLESDI